jgi:hypothetical protein
LYRTWTDTDLKNHACPPEGVRWHLRVKIIIIIIITIIIIIVVAVNMEDLGVDGRMILKQRLMKTGWKGLDYIDLAQDRDK